MDSVQLVDAFFAFVLVGLLLLLGLFIKQKITLFQRLHLPESIIAGTIALILGPEVLGLWIQSSPFADTGFNFLGLDLANGLFSEAIQTIWKQSPEVFINVVFATLFLGEHIPSPREIWRKAAPQIAFGQSLAWGQYVVGLAVAIWVLEPLCQTNPLSGTLIEIAFEGGHGTAAGMGTVLEKLGFEAGADLAYILATIGIVSGVICGTILVNWGYHQGHVTVSSEALEEASEKESISQQNSPNSFTQLLVDPLSLNCGITGAAIAMGWLMLKSLQILEMMTWGKTGFVVFEYMPLFPFAAIGGILLQLIIVRFNLTSLVSRSLQENISGVALDVVIVSAFASISLQVLGANGLPLLILSLVGILWNIGAFLFLAPRFLPDYWFERGLGDLGQSMGVTATGILLIQMVDPHNRSGALESFAYKQLLFAPLVGGGVVTAITPILIVEFSPTTVFLIMLSLLIVWISFGFAIFKQLSQN